MEKLKIGRDETKTQKNYKNVLVEINIRFLRYEIEPEQIQI